MYIPRHFHFAYPITTILLGFYVKQRYGESFDTYFVLFALTIAALIHAVWIYKAGMLYQKYQTKLDEPDTKLTEKDLLAMAHERARQLDLEPVDLPPVKVYGKAMSLPQFNKERNFAITLIRQQEEFGYADMTEEKWVKTKKFTRDEFKAMLGLWEEYGLIERASPHKNAPYIVKDWLKIRAVADGNMLGNKSR